MGLGGMRTPPVVEDFSGRWGLFGPEDRSEDARTTAREYGELYVKTKRSNAMRQWMEYAEVLALLPLSRIPAKCHLGQVLGRGCRRAGAGTMTLLQCLLGLARSRKRPTTRDPAGAPDRKKELAPGRDPATCTANDRLAQRRRWW